MAPNGSGKSRGFGPGKQGTGSNGPRLVVPAIPLPYVQRQAAARAAAAAAAAAKPPTPEPVGSKVTEKPVVNGAPTSSSKAEEPTSPPVPESEQGGSSLADKVGSPSSVKVNGGNTNAPMLETPSSEPTVVNTAASVTGSSVTVARASQQVDIQSQPAPKPTSETNDGSQARLPAASNNIDPKPKPAQEQSSQPTKTRPPPSISPTRHHMPPPFQPGRPIAMMPNGDMSRGPRPPMPNGPPHMHQAHPSNGSVHFGVFQESENSSPAPPMSGGMAPPPGMPHPDGRPPYMGPGPNGYPPMMPYGPEMMQMSGYDSYGRAGMGYAPMDTFPGYGNNYGPSTPHSFHGSQSSAPHEDSGAYGQYQANRPRNSVGGPADEAMAQQGRMYGAPEYPRMMPESGAGMHSMSSGDDADGLLAFMHQQFSNPEFSDCALELRYLDDRAPPVRIPSHRMVLSRSPILQDLLRKQALQPSAPEPSQQMLLLETDSKWIRSDAFYMAVQRLYGAPLLSPPPMNVESGDIRSAGTAKERLSFALSYAAAGDLLQWNSLVKRGCEVATQVLDWETIEMALAFALDGFVDIGHHEALKYGEGARILLHAIVTFIVHNLPTSLSIDASAPDSETYSRLPEPVLQTATSNGDSASPIIARGSSVSFGKGHRAQKLSSIQFGDLSTSEGSNDATTATPRATRPANPISHAVLSRILLNLPFMYLKMVLESSSSGNVNGWANAESRYRVIKEAVEERERRRLRVVESVMAGKMPDARAVQTFLRSPEPRVFGPWTVLGWQEEMLPYGNPDGPSLGRRWVPLKNIPSDSGRAYP